MGRAVNASSRGFVLEVLCDRYHAKGRESRKRIRVVIPASLNDKINGLKSRAVKVSTVSLLFT